jgi:hypothetical protein
MLCAVLAAEVVHHFCPKLIELHNYSPANGTQQKVYNWNTLNTRTLKKINYTVSKADVNAICNCKPQVVEKILLQLKDKVRDKTPRSSACDREYGI